MRGTTSWDFHVGKGVQDRRELLELTLPRSSCVLFFFSTKSAVTVLLSTNKPLRGVHVTSNINQLWSDVWRLFINLYFHCTQNPSLRPNTAKLQQWWRGLKLVINEHINSQITIMPYPLRSLPPVHCWFPRTLNNLNLNIGYQTVSYAVFLHTCYIRCSTFCNVFTHFGFFSI